MYRGPLPGIRLISRCLFTCLPRSSRLIILVKLLRVEHVLVQETSRIVGEGKVFTNPEPGARAFSHLAGHILIDEFVESAYDTAHGSHVLIWNQFLHSRGDTRVHRPRADTVHGNLLLAPEPDSYRLGETNDLIKRISDICPDVP